MKVSVILPVYYGEKTLENTLQSLLKQTCKSFELIACIDGSNDGSMDILKAYKEKFDRLIILKNDKNLGLGATLNKLIANANGEYIAMAEQDDYYYPYRLEKQVDFLERNLDYGLVSGIAEFFDGSRVAKKFPGILVHGKTYPHDKELFTYLYVNQSKIVNTCMMFRKSVHVNNGLYFSTHYPNISIDWAYFLRFCLKSKIHGLHDVLVRMDRRISRNSLTTQKANVFKANRELIRAFKFEFPEIISSELYKKAKAKQADLELRSHYGTSLFFTFLVTIFKYPFYKFAYISLIERLNKMKR